MKVFTYFSEVRELHDPDLLKIWERSWRKYGWEPVITSEADARRTDPVLFRRFSESPLLKSHPNNPASYVRACLLRWIPLAAVEEPCVHTDLDVICNGYQPSDVPKYAFPLTFLGGSYCPCAMYGNMAAWRMMLAILDGAPDMAQFDPVKLATDNADQYVTAYEMPADWANVADPAPCRWYGQPGWRDGKLLHFAGVSTPKPRSVTIAREGFAV